jgi:hypothetical protein
MTSDNDDRRVLLVRLSILAMATGIGTIFGWFNLSTAFLLVVTIPFSVEQPFAPLAIAFQAIALVVGYAVVAAASRRKALVVYLRRFGRSEANAAVETALRKKLDARYRIITLDDGQFVPLHMLARSGLVMGTPTALGCGFLSLVAIVTYVALLRFAPTITGGIWLGILMSTAIMLPLVVGVLALALALSIIAVIHALRLRRRRTLIVESPDDLAAVATIVARLKSWWRRPSLADVHSMTIKTADTIWQPTVQRFLAMADLILFDVSERTSNLEWELERVHEACPDRVVSIVGNRETETGDAVSYANAGRRARATFQRSLRGRLDSLLGSVGRRSIAAERRKRAMPRMPLIYLLIVASCDAAAILAWPAIFRFLQSNG